MELAVVRYDLEPGMGTPKASLLGSKYIHGFYHLGDC